MKCATLHIQNRDLASESVRNVAKSTSFHWLWQVILQLHEQRPHWVERWLPSSAVCISNRKSYAAVNIRKNAWESKWGGFFSSILVECKLCVSKYGVVTTIRTRLSYVFRALMWWAFAYSRVRILEFLGGTAHSGQPIKNGKSGRIKWYRFDIFLQQPIRVWWAGADFI